MPSVRSHAFSMFLSAAIFGVVGFYMFTWDHRFVGEPGPDGEREVLLMIVLLKWAIQGGAIVFAITGILALFNQVSGLFMYAVAGLITASVFLAVAVWEMTTVYRSDLTPVLLIVFAGWNGYTSVASLRDAVVLARMRTPEACSG